MYFGILSTNPWPDEMIDAKMESLEIVVGFENKNVNPRIPLGNQYGILYFCYDKDAIAYKDAVIRESKEDLFPVQVRKIEVVNFDV